jgi:thiosulfate/3-mercaptopyruvate sulfurtransferase
MFTTLISAINLAQHGVGLDWVVFDCRHDLAKPEAGAEAYRQAHLPGAHFAHTDRDLSGPKTGTNGRHPLPDRDRFRAFLADHGVSDSTQLIAYDASGGMYAARLWWLARWLGHERAAVLDGGLAAWTEAGYSLSSEVPKALAGSLATHEPLVPSVDVANVLAHLHDGERILIDARAGERYRGEIEPLDPRAGHIPGAVNRYFQLNLNAQGRFKPAGILRDEFMALLGDTDPALVVHQCGSGVTACHNLLAMEVAGLHGAALYPGSWSQWCADPARPVAEEDAT